MSEDETTSGPELLLAAPTRERGALGPQVERALRAAVQDGRLGPGDRLPPTRALAHDLGVSRRLVVAAYEQLVAEGRLEARVGSGTFVVRGLPARPAARLAPMRGAVGPLPGARGGVDFFPGHPDLAAFPRATWSRCVRDALHELPDAALGYGDPRGLLELREELQAHAARTRGVLARPEQLVVCQGAVQGLTLLVAALRAGGGPVRVGVEDPGLPEHRRVLEAAGAELVPLPVDALGIRDEAVAAADVSAVVLTPAHQCPTGVVLSAGRRGALVRWARATGGLLVEDDYDAEHRYDRAPAPALQGLAPEHVVLLGTVSKTLAPALRLGWLVVPEDRLAAVTRAKRLADGGSPVLEQAALARFIRGGHLDRHVRASRRAHRRRRDALLDALARELPDARVTGVAAGLHAVVRLPSMVAVAPLLAACAAREVTVYPLASWRADPPPETDALVLGYGALSAERIAEGVRRLGAALADLRGT